MEPDSREVETFEAKQVVVTLQDFEEQQPGDLPFKKGDTLTIVEPSSVLHWYVARDLNGRTGTVPNNYLQSLTLKESEASAVDSDLCTQTVTIDGDDYLPMHPPSKPSSQLTKMDRENLAIQIREEQRRLAPGTLVIATTVFDGPVEGDLPFNMYDEMTILKPLPDLCWYHAQLVDDVSKRGAIPITHVRLVYMSDDDTDDEIKGCISPIHERLYDDFNDFLSESGWFSFPGMALSKDALVQVLVKKANMEMASFTETKESVYMLEYRHGEKVYIGKAEVLKEELLKHFDCFGRPKHEIREIDDELCHHTAASDWNMTVWPMEPDQNLELEWAKKIVEHNSLRSTASSALKASSGGKNNNGNGEGESCSESVGLNDDMSFSSMQNWEAFWKWFSPN